MKQILHLSILGILCIMLFGIIFKSLQNETIYRHSLGLISKNYERTGSWSDYKISRVNKPYTEISNENYLHWDASIYNCISERMYTAEEAYYGKVRAAFFPLFPMLWKVSHLSPRMISLLNYIIFLLSIALLVSHLLPKNKEAITIFIALITLPTTVIYMIPYSESLFLLCMTIAAIGILKNRYPLYFAGVLFMSMVRPATVFVLLAILATELFFFMKNRRLSSFIKGTLLKSLPFVIGYAAVLLIQYRSSGSWTAFFDAQAHWTGGFQRISKISDWSVEGFGLNTFSIFFVAVPASIYLLYLGARLIMKKQIQLGSGQNRSYLLLLSLFYLAGIFAFTILTSGGNIHSFFRFTMCSPFFYIAIIIAISEVSKANSLRCNIIFGSMFIALFLFFIFVEYGGARFQFSYAGVLLLILTFLYLLNRQFIPAKYHSLLLSLLVVLNTVWNTYMLNMFFSNGWIFT